MKREDEDSAINAAEAQFMPLLVVDDLVDEYHSEDLTQQDCLLRMTLDGNEEGGVKIMRQTIQMLLDIFSKNAYERLGVRFKWDEDKDVNEYVYDDTGCEVKNLKHFVDMEKILKPLLDRELVSKSEFVTWYNKQTETLQRI
jgi:hypothetical protein